MSSLVLTSDSLASPAVAGTLEYTSPAFFATPIGTQRGIVPTQQYYRLNSTVAGAQVTTAQSIFGVGVTLSSSTVYEFEALYTCSKTAGATSHNLGFGFGGTATVNNILYETIGGVYIGSGGAGTLVTNSAYYIGSVANTTANTIAFSNITTATFTFSYIVRGTVSVNAGGTFIPQYTLSVDPGGAYTTQIGSYIRINPLGASGAAINVGTWA
jgi:hypothetical protein